MLITPNQTRKHSSGEFLYPQTPSLRGILGDFHCLPKHGAQPQQPSFKQNTQAVSFPACFQVSQRLFACHQAYS